MSQPGTLSVRLETSWRPLSKPLAECRVALVTSAGFVLPEQEPFDASFRGGDPSFREIPNDVAVRTLRESHRSKSFDHSGMRLDPNVAFPVDRLRELERGGHIGSVNRRHLSFMGSITAPGRLIQYSASGFDNGRPQVGRQWAI